MGEVSLHTALLAAEPFRAANRLGGGKPFESAFVGIHGGELQTMIGVPLPTCAMADLTDQVDLVFVLACYETNETDKQRIFSWLRYMRQKGAMIAGLDFAPLLMAEAGLLTNKRVTSHWSTLGAFSEHHMDVEIEDALYLIDGNIVTCAGQIAALDLSMALLKRMVTADMYEAVQNDLVYRPRDAQRRSPVKAIMQGDRSMANAQSIMEAHIEDPISVEDIARQVGVSKRELQRRFQRHLHRSPIDFYREIRLKRALNLLQYSTLTIREIGIATGFSEPSTFYRAFRERFQKGPQELRTSFHSGHRFRMGVGLGSSPRDPLFVIEAEMQRLVHKCGHCQRQ